MYSAMLLSHQHLHMESRHAQRAEYQNVLAVAIIQILQNCPANDS